MSTTFYVQECPTCGRRLHIRVGYLGKKVMCEHCRGSFIARDPDGVADGCTLDGNALLRRADELLESLAHRYPPTSPLT